MAQMGGLMVYLSAFIGGIVGLSLAPDFVGYCNTVANDANVTGTTSEVFYATILPILYAVLCVAGIAGGIYKMFKQ